MPYFKLCFQFFILTSFILMLLFPKSILIKKGKKKVIGNLPARRCKVVVTGHIFNFSRPWNWICHCLQGMQEEERIEGFCSTSAPLSHPQIWPISGPAGLIKKTRRLVVSRYLNDWPVTQFFFLLEFNLIPIARLCNYTFISNHDFSHHSKKGEWFQILMIF